AQRTPRGHGAGLLVTQAVRGESQDVALLLEVGEESVSFVGHGSHAAGHGSSEVGGWWRTWPSSRPNLANHWPFFRPEFRLGGGIPGSEGPPPGTLARCPTSTSSPTAPASAAKPNAAATTSPPWPASSTPVSSPTSASTVRTAWGCSRWPTGASTTTST